MALKQIIKNIIALGGYEVARVGSRVAVSADPYEEQSRLLAGRRALTLLDVGAHQGETSLRYRSLFPEACIHAFEPFGPSFDKLCAVTKADRNIFTHKKALGCKSGKSRLSINRSHATNSLLESREDAKLTWNQSDAVDTVDYADVEVCTLDEFSQRHNIRSIDVLKMDAQGSEYDIIKGAGGLIAEGRIEIVFSEIIIMPTYKGQREFDEFLLLMRQCGFVLHGLYNFCHADDGRINQADGLFRRLATPWKFH